MRLLALPALVFLLAACGGISKEECLYADWRAVGFEDGSRGSPVSAISGRRKACAEKAAVTVDMTAYLAGRQQGLREFCRPASGFNFGARGGNYSGVCNPSEEHTFLIAFEKGARLYAFNQNVAHAAKALNRAEHDLEHVLDDIAYAEVALVSLETPHTERLDHLVRLKQLNEERKRLRAENEARAYDLDMAEAERADYVASLDAQGGYAGGVIAPSRARY